ncbi:MAG: amidohydrolase family protein [Pyrinomonadaceae bacterium]|nr:amidohydrolase family protein [Pyrinomonadaceae bacterium]
MKRRFTLLLLLYLLFHLPFTCSYAQTFADPSLSAEIARIKIIDNHAHPMRFTATGEPPDNEYDALPGEGLEAPGLPFRLGPDNPEWIEAWRALFGYKYTDASPEHMRELTDAKLRVMIEQGERYPAWVLDSIGIDTMLANRVAMGKGLVTGRFRWVSFVDALLFPLSNEQSKSVNPDYRVFFTEEERLFKRYLRESGLSAPPSTLDQYLRRVITPTLERQKRAGAVAVKFEAAYLRSLDFSDATFADASRIYSRYARGVVPPAAEYKTLQDFLFRHIAREAGKLSLAVHIHTGGGIGAYFNVTNSNPLLLMSAFNDKSLSRTNFVLIHGGWPFARQVTGLLNKQNVYLDFSAQSFILYPRELSENIRAWLEFAPEKVMFGTDAFTFGPEVGWAEVAWLSTRTGREALALALTGMEKDKEITRARALELARMVLRENARNLYGFK